MRSSPVSAVAFFDPVRIGAAGGAVAAVEGAGGVRSGLSSRAREIRCSPVSAPAWFEDRGGRGPSTRASPALPAARPTTDAPRRDSPRPDSPLPVGGLGGPPLADGPPLSVGWTVRPSHSHQRSSCPPPLWPFPSPSCAGERPARRTRGSKRGRSLEGASGAPCLSCVTRRRDNDKLPGRPRKRHIRPSTQVGDPAGADYTPLVRAPSMARSRGTAGGRARRSRPRWDHDLTGNRPATDRSAHSRRDHRSQI